MVNRTSFSPRFCDSETSYTRHSVWRYSNFILPCDGFQQEKSEGVYTAGRRGTEKNGIFEK